MEDLNNKRKHQFDELPRVPSPMQMTNTHLYCPKRIKINTIYEENEDNVSLTISKKPNIKITVEDCEKDEEISKLKEINPEPQPILQDNFNIFDLIQIHKNHIKCDSFYVNFVDNFIPIICAKLSCAIQFINNYYAITNIDNDLFKSLFYDKLNFDITVKIDHNKICKLYEFHCEETPLRYMQQEIFNKDINPYKENHLQTIANDITADTDNIVDKTIFKSIEFDNIEDIDNIKIKWYSDDCHNPEHWSKQNIYVKTTSDTFKHINSLMEKYVKMKSRIGDLPGFELNEDKTFIIYPFSTIDIAGLIKEDLTDLIFSTKIT